MRDMLGGEVGEVRFRGIIVVPGYHIWRMGLYIGILMAADFGCSCTEGKGGVASGEGSPIVTWFGESRFAVVF